MLKKKKTKYDYFKVCVRCGEYFIDYKGSKLCCRACNKIIQANNKQLHLNKKTKRYERTINGVI